MWSFLIGQVHRDRKQDDEWRGLGEEGMGTFAFQVGALVSEDENSLEMDGGLHQLMQMWVAQEQYTWKQLRGVSVLPYILVTIGNLKTKNTFK